MRSNLLFHGVILQGLRDPGNLSLPYLCSGHDVAFCSAPDSISTHCDLEPKTRKRFAHRGPLLNLPGLLCVQNMMLHVLQRGRPAAVRRRTLLPEGHGNKGCLLASIFCFWWRTFKALLGILKACANMLLPLHKVIRSETKACEEGAWHFFFFSLSLSLSLSPPVPCLGITAEPVLPERQAAR